MNRDALNVAMTVAPDLRLRTGAVTNGLSGGHAAIVMQADDLAVVVGEVLRRVRLEIAFRRHLAIAERQEQEAVAVERDLAAEMSAALRDRFEELLHVGEPIVLEAPANQRRRRLRCRRRSASSR